MILILKDDVRVITQYQIDVNTKEEKILERSSKWFDEKLNSFNTKIDRDISDKEWDLFLSLDMTLSNYKKKVEEYEAKIDDQNSEYKRLVNRNKRKEQDLPTLVSLEEIYQKYSQSNYLNFTTDEGELTIQNIKYYFLPESKKIAYIKIGEESVTKRSELIKAFIEDSETSKIKEGYRLIKNQNSSTDYGKIKKKTFVKGDAYMNTSYEFERVQGTYDRHSFLYTYYIELGSVSRKKEFKSQHYANRIGN